MIFTAPVLIAEYSVDPSPYNFLAVVERGRQVSVMISVIGSAIREEIDDLTKLQLVKQIYESELELIEPIVRDGLPL